MCSEAYLLVVLAFDRLQNIDVLHGAFGELGWRQIEDVGLHAHMDSNELKLEPIKFIDAPESQRPLRKLHSRHKLITNQSRTKSFALVSTSIEKLSMNGHVYRVRV